MMCKKNKLLLERVIMERAVGRVERRDKKKDMAGNVWNNEGSVSWHARFNLMEDIAKMRR
jgi:hypothetical protein